MAEQKFKQPWLTILGIGDNGLDSLSSEARQLFEETETIIAPARVLDVIDTGDRETIPWTFGVKDTIEFITKRRGQNTTILATGDPMHFGIGATLRRSFSADEMYVVPSPSGFSLAAAKLGWALQDVAQISLHGRAVSGLHVHLSPRRRILSLTSNKKTIIEVAKLLVGQGYGASTMTILEHIGGRHERSMSCLARDIDADSFECADFNMLAIDCTADVNTPLLPAAGGLPDDAFVHDGQLTKREVRAVTLSYLSPSPHMELWDVGAGCGSVGIEWMRAAHGATATAIEQDAARCSMIGKNSQSLGIPKLKIVEGAAPEALSSLPTPDAIFIGGGLTRDGVFDACWSALGDGKRLVANAVTVESEAKLLELHATYGGALTRMQVARAEPVGRFSGWKPLMPVTIWSIVKGYQT